MGVRYQVSQRGRTRGRRAARTSQSVQARRRTGAIATTLSPEANVASSSDLSQLEVFVRVVTDGGFTAAADGLGVSKSFVSRQIGHLEDRLGARLLNRTTRKLTLTDIGAVFYERCRRILDELAEAEGAVTNLQSAPRGMLRIAAPMSFGVGHVAPAVAEFLHRHPELSVNIDFSDRRVDLLDEGFDLAIRIGALADSSMIARKLATTHLVVVASPAYLAAHPKIETPAALRDHECLQYAYSPTGQQWRLTDGKNTVTVEATGRVTGNNGEGLAQFAAAGLGCALMPDFIIAGPLTRGEVVRVLPGWCQASAVSAVYPHNRHLSAKVRVFVDFLAERWSDPPWQTEDCQRG